MYSGWSAGEMLQKCFYGWWQSGFENPGHAGHMCLATFENRKPYLAGPKAQQY